MANLKISQLTDGSPVQATDQFPINRAGANFRVSGITSTGLLQTTVTIPSATFVTIDNTFANSILVLPLSGAGNQYILDRIITNRQAVSTPYATGTGDLELFTSDGVSTLALYVDFLSSANIKLSTSFLSTAAGSLTGAAPVAPNTQWRMALSTATKYTAGDGVFVIELYYRNIAVA